MKTSKKFPLVSVCTPTYNRRPFFPTLFQCFLNQTYPKSRIEWIIVDDGTDSIEDLVKDANIPQIHYHRVEEKMSLGEKRNYMHSKTKGQYLVYMDDDDYYPPERIKHAVSKLQANPWALCAGSSQLYIYFHKLNCMKRFGPYGENHATAGTFAFRRALLDQSRYDDYACLAEERQFLQDYTVPMVQLNPLKTILVFAHSHNSVDKYRLLETSSTHCHNTDKTVRDFIRKSTEDDVFQFFTRFLHESLILYDLGNPKYKKDVCQYLYVLHRERTEATRFSSTTITHRDKELTAEDTVRILERQHKIIGSLIQENTTLKESLQTTTP